MKSFFTGNFLPGYSSAYRYKPTPLPKSGCTPEEQTERFQQRATRFENKKTGYAITLQVGAVVACLLIIGLLKLDFSTEQTFEITLVEQEIVEMEEIVQTNQQALPPPPPRPPVPIEVPNDEVLDDSPLDLDASLDINEPLASLPPPPPPEEEEETDEEPEIFVVVENPPQMIGGLAALSKDLEYPIVARQAGLEGVVVIQVVVDEQGQPNRPQVMRSVHDVLDEAAVAAVLKQRFKPGTQRGRAVKVQIAVPVRFRLTDG